MIDYINRNRLDNRSCNLRETILRENILNYRLRKHNISGFNSIYYYKRDKR